MNIPFQQDVPLAPLTTFKIGGPADYFVDVKTVDDLVAAVVTGRKLSLIHI